VKGKPTILEGEESPFTEAGHRHIKNLEQNIKWLTLCLPKGYSPKLTRGVETLDQMDARIDKLEADLEAERQKSSELEDLVMTMKNQL
jgi:transposase